MRKEQYYRLKLDNYAAPSFCSSDKEFFGTLEQISILINDLRNDEKYAENFKELILAFDWFIENKKNIFHTVSHRKIKFLEPVQLLEFYHTTSQEFEWVHNNIWGFKYRMKVSQINISIAIFEVEGKIVKTIKPEFKDLMHYNDFAHSNNWELIDNNFWGFPYMLKTKDRWTCSSLFITEGIYSNVKSAESNINDVNKINFESVCDEIFADG